MKQRLMLLFSIILTSLLIVTGCAENNPESTQPDSTESSEVNETKIEIVISKDEGAEELSSKEIVIEEDDILMDVLKDNFDVEEDNGFITAIDGVEQDVDAQIGWIYFVNDETAMVGAN